MPVAQNGEPAQYFRGADVEQKQTNARSSHRRVEESRRQKISGTQTVANLTTKPKNKKKNFFVRLGDLPCYNKPTPSTPVV